MKLPARWDWKAWRALAIVTFSAYLASCGIASKPTIKPVATKADAPVVIAYEHPVAVIATHPWFVYSQDGFNWFLIEVREKPDAGRADHSHVYEYHARGEAMPDAWRRIARGGGERRRWHGDTALSTIAFLASAQESYPKRFDYEDLGPNSNTFAQWVADHTPIEDDFLGTDAIGAGWKD